MQSENSQYHALESSSTYNIYLYVTSTDADILSEETVNHQLFYTFTSGSFNRYVDLSYYFEDENGQRLTKLSYNTPGQDIFNIG